MADAMTQLPERSIRRCIRRVILPAVHPPESFSARRNSDRRKCQRCGFENFIAAHAMIAHEGALQRSILVC
jgi:hypothetical protein